MEKNKELKLYFYLRYHTQYGESLWLQGTTSLLGLDNNKLELEYLNNDYWMLAIELSIDAWPDTPFEYHYLIQNKEGAFRSESEQKRTLSLSGILQNTINIFDVWSFAGQFEQAFYTAPFTRVLLPDAPKVKTKLPETTTHTFKIKAPLLAKNEVVCLLGSCNSLNNWDTTQPLLMAKKGTDWVISQNLEENQFPIEYKYGIYNKKRKEFVRFEEGDNRVCTNSGNHQEFNLLQDGFINLPNTTWKGAGIAIPVFSLRSKESFGSGEFTDLKLLTDWAVKTGLKLIQILPVNDTTATGSNQDSYPYAAISAFALHPIYINLAMVAEKQHKKLLEPLKTKQKQLNEAADLQYEEVLHIKMAVLKELYDEEGPKSVESKGFKKFFKNNEPWLKAYAVFCYLRDQNKTTITTHWKTNALYDAEEITRFFDKNSDSYSQVLFHCFVQYHLHLQLRDAVKYAHKKGIILKGDIPIGVYRHGCDAWMTPDLFKIEMQVGAPPDDFAVTGQNWGFPTYDWQKMQSDGFNWWKQRFEQMSHYFDAFRIDHILGFFRIWSIPLHAVQGIMGRFDPCIPVRANEFQDQGIRFDHDRFCNPLINDEVLEKIFGTKSSFVKEKFLHNDGFDSYALLSQFDTQQKIQSWWQQQDSSETDPVLRDGLMDLVSNVLLFEEEGSNGQYYHFRIVMERTLSFQLLPPFVQERLKSMYQDYFYQRQDDFWRKEALRKLPQLKATTDMLVCGEDLGMVPACVPDVMRQLGILSLEVQRMPKELNVEFFNPGQAPYLSVITPSTHDMSTLRGWWLENRDATQRFYNQLLQQEGAAPQDCTPQINKAIVVQHLNSPAMWSIFQLQDLLGISQELRRNNPQEERINNPADPNHYWCYRMHLTLEQLLKEKAFNKDLKTLIQAGGR